MLEINILNKTFNKNNQKKIIFEDVNIKLPNVGLILLKGNSGIGKTTLLNLISKLDNDFKGYIKYDNQEISKEFVKTNVSYLMQNDNLIENISVYDNLNLYNELSEEQIDKLLKFLSIIDLKDKKIKYLSSGEKRRVAIARTLLKQPKIILLDEVTSNLDNNNSKNIMELLKIISKNVLIIYSSHDESIYNYADVLLEVKDYKIEKQIINNLEDKKINLSNNYTINSKYKNKILKSTIFNIKSNLTNIAIMSLLFLTSLTFIILSNFDISKVLTDTLRLNNNNYINSDSQNDKLISFTNSSSHFFKIINVSLDNVEFVYYEPPYRNDFTTYENMNLFDYIGALPLNDNEIMIYQILAENIIYYYFANNNQVNNIDDLIGKEIITDNNTFTISGIIKQDLSIFEKLKHTKIDDNDIDANLLNLFNGKVSNYYNEVIITNQNTIDILNNKYEIFNDNNRTKKIYIDNYNEMYRIIKKNTMDYDLNKLLLNRNHFNVYDTEYSKSLTDLFYILTIVSKISPVLAIIFSLISIMFMYTFVRNYMDKNNKNISILKLIGFEEHEILNNYTLGIMFQTLLSIVLSLLIFIVLNLIMNAYFSKLYYFYVDILNISFIDVILYSIMIIILIVLMYIYIKKYFKNIRISYVLRNN